MAVGHLHGVQLTVTLFKSRAKPLYSFGRNLFYLPMTFLKSFFQVLTWARGASRPPLLLDILDDGAGILVSINEGGHCARDSGA